MLSQAQGGAGAGSVFDAYGGFRLTGVRSVDQPAYVVRHHFRNGHVPGHLHGFQQGGLGFGGGAVDFIRQHDVGELRAFLKKSFFCCPLPVERGGRDVAGQQVRGELDAARRDGHGLGKALDQFRLAQAGDPSSRI